MKDRAGNAYVPVWERLPGEAGEAEVDREIGHVRQIGVLSPARQADKALGLSGRQRKKRRKALRRSAGHV